MRGGRYQQKAIDDVNSRNAEALFETRTVVEIREVEARTRKEIEEKKEELRQLVGASYRDLIESADSILLMRQSCEAVADNIQRMEEGMVSLKNSITLSAVSSESEKERKRREGLFGLGGRVKYLVDTPEKIWGCLDEHMYLEGSERYLRAKEVHSILTGTAGESSELFATFPLLRHQWPLVETFRGQISQRSRDRLQEPGLKVDEYAIALAATGIIEELTANQIFALFLETRKMWLRAHLRAANAVRERAMEKAGGKFDKRSSRSGETGIADLLQKGEKVAVTGSDTDNIAATLCRIGHMIQASLCHAGELFLEVSGKMPLLFSKVLTAPPGSQLFGGIPNPEREVKLWKAHREKLELSMVSLSAKSITDSCICWLRKCAGEIAVEGKLLLQHVKSGKELAEVERVVRDDLAQQLALGESLDWLKIAFGGAFDSPWNCLCDLLLREPTSLWDVLFENMFVSRMKEVIDSGFQDISIEDPLKTILSSHGSFEGVRGQVVGRQLEDLSRFIGGENRNPVLRLEGGVSVWQSMVDEKDSNAAFFNPEVTKLKDEVDEGFRDVLEDSLCFFQGPRSTSRTDELASYLQEQCRLCMMTIVNVLRVQLSELSESMNEVAESSRKAGSKAKKFPEGLGQLVGSNGNLSESTTGGLLESSRIVAQALFLGRLSAAVGQHSSYLPIILGSPTQWRARVKTASLKGSTGLLGNKKLSNGRDQVISESSDRWLLKKGKSGNIGNGDISSKLGELLRHQSIAAHSIWVDWSAEDLTESFSRDLQNDDCLSTSTPLKGWEDTVLKQEEEGGGEVEMKLALPAMPSPYAVLFLFSGCEEIYRVGGHVLDTDVLKLFAWKLCEKVVSAYERFLSDPSVFSIRVSEKGLLQLLFDLRFLADVLSGGQDVALEGVDYEEKIKDLGLGVGSRSKSSSLLSDTSSQALRKRVATLISKVLNKLDPIDWATYEPHLWENECRYYQRTAVLFGSLVQLNRLYTDTVLEPSAHSDINTLNMTGTVPRFTYLPISAPMFSVSGGPGSRLPRNLTQDDSVSGSWTGYANGEDGYKYGSSDLPSQSSIVGARPLIRSLMGQVGSRFGEGLKLGLLSDKSAAAISTFGDMLPMQAAGLFSSLTAGTSKEY